MKSLFEVNGYNRFENNKKMAVSVYGVSRNESGITEFLVYNNDRWYWSEAKNYTPIANKHE